MREEIRIKLSRLGVVKGTRQLKSVSPEARPSPAIIQPLAPTNWQDDEPAPLLQLLPGGQVVETDNGGCFVLDRVYPLSHQHGRARLADTVPLSLAPTTQFGHDARLADLTCADILFLDTETTGLSGAGVLAFMVGAAFFEGDAFIVRQFFLRDHGDEPAMLHLLGELMAAKKGLMTFNGRSFDLPLLDNRYLMNRLDPPIGPLLDYPHLDLLFPARRLWRSRLTSCSLSSLEQNLLGIQRNQADAPGWLIPSLYNNYLRTGDGRELLRVFYHNEIDMLSMVTLVNEELRQLSQPDPSDHPADLLSLAKWQQAAGRLAVAEATARLLLSLDPPLELYQPALLLLGNLLKRQDRREEAAVLWRQAAAVSFDDVTAHIELAKYYEWQRVDLPQAIHYTEQALTLLDKQQTAQDEELRHRLNRLQRKISQE
jgi:uncharacterized protein